MFFVLVFSNNLSYKYIFSTLKLTVIVFKSNCIVVILNNIARLNLYSMVLWVEFILHELYKNTNTIIYKFKSNLMLVCKIEEATKFNTINEISLWILETFYVVNFNVFQ